MEEGERRTNERPGTTQSSILMMRGTNNASEEMGKDEGRERGGE